MSLPLLYRKSPVLIQNALVSLRGYQIQRTRFNKEFYPLLHHFEASSPSEVNVDQLQVFLHEADNSQFWRNRFRKYNVNIEADDPIAELKKLPVLSKEEVKENIDDILNPGIDKKELKKVQTGGTTGSGLIFFQTQSMENAQWAVWWRYWHRIGVTKNTWCGWFGGMSIIDVEVKRPPFWRINYPGKQIMFSPQHLNEDTIVHIYDKIVRSNLKWLHGYPSQIALLASLILEKNLEPLKMNFITTGAESLLEHQKEVIREALGVIPMMHYGLSEGVANISQLPDYSLQADQDFAYCEFLPSDHEGIHRIVGTNYHNVAFPLIRYDTGDLATISDKDGKTVIEKIEGRSQDFIHLDNGITLGPLNHVFKDLDFIREAQIYLPAQKDRLIIRVVPGRNWDRDTHENHLLKNLKSRLTGSIPLEIVYLDKIPRTSSGKLKLFVEEEME